MSDAAAAVWDDFVGLFEKLNRRIAAVKTVNVNSQRMREEAKYLVQQYFRGVRTVLIETGIQQPELDSLDAALQYILRLANGHNAVSSYKKHLRIIRKNLSILGGRLEIQLADRSIKGAGRTSAESEILRTLRELIPSAAASYEQALVDLNGKERASFRGTSVELREALREVLDHLAPDDAVMREPSFKLEKNLSKPTMKQKVKFILNARKGGRTASSAPEDAASAVDEIVSSLARSVYTQGSLATHVASTKADALRLKRYVEVVLFDLFRL